MHELSIADALVRIACRHADGRRIESVEVKVGHLRQVVPDALTFAWTLVAKGTGADGAQLIIEEVPAVGVCRGCGAQSEWDAFPLACTACGSADVEILRGEELLVDAMTMEEVPSGRC
jgi:hydrogenase nickel incorporation protein HypA/HybF